MALGRREEALAAIEDAVAVYRELAAAWPGAAGVAWVRAAGLIARP